MLLSLDNLRCGVLCCLLSGMHPPAQHVAECWNSAEFFANKLMKDFRGVDDRQVAWAKALKVCASDHQQDLPGMGWGQ